MNFVSLLTGLTVRHSHRCLRPATSVHAKLLSTKQETPTTPAVEIVTGQNAAQNDEDRAYVEDIRKKILAASMEFVPEEGWTSQALARGAEAVGYASTVHSIMPYGPAHLVHFFTVNCNSKLADNMHQIVEQTPKGPANPVKFIEDSIIARIEMQEPHKSRWADAMAVIIKKGMVLEHGNAMLKMIDDICYFAGDRSVNAEWYARRAVVGAIYEASQLHWLGGGKDTRSFTASQLQCASDLQALPYNLKGLLTIAQNIIPINFNR